jgi:hypothetical protein
MAKPVKKKSLLDYADEYSWVAIIGIVVVVFSLVPIFISKTVISDKTKSKSKTEAYHESIQIDKLFV